MPPSDLLIPKCQLEETVGGEREREKRARRHATKDRDPQAVPMGRVFAFVRACEQIVYTRHSVGWIAKFTIRS